ncbi:MAG: hypothetical protein Q9214_004969 [Letrouitia sp. 1 TL-2023]
MSSFFTAPASKRKRGHEDSTFQSKRKKQKSNGITSDRKLPVKSTTRSKRDESISSDDFEDDDKSEAAGSDRPLVSSDSEGEDETGAERRLRLARRYLETVQEEIQEHGFDAEEVDRDLIADRLREDVAQTKGKLYRRIASEFDFPTAAKTHLRANTLTTTSVAVCLPYIYTVSKDISLIKWEFPIVPGPRHPDNDSKASSHPRRAKKIFFTQGSKAKAGNRDYSHHTAPIFTVAASPSGQFVVTGGADKRLIVWSASDLKPLRVFTAHRDAVTGLAFRRGTNQLFSSSKDRTIKSWSLDELAYVETLFGHQDEVVDVAALAAERCVSVGARDRSARLWEVVEEKQLVFRSGGRSEKGKPANRHLDANSGPAPISYSEGSIDRVAVVDEDTFVTGSDNGAISLWSIHRKKPVFTIPVAHGLDPPLTPEESSAEQEPDPEAPAPPQPRWVTALATVPYSDLILSGSWDGWVRVWKISQDKKKIEEVGAVGWDHSRTRQSQVTDGDLVEDGCSTQPKDQGFIQGIINDLETFERGDKGEDGLCVVAALGKEHRLGRWKQVRGRNETVVFEISKATLYSSDVR